MKVYSVLVGDRYSSDTFTIKAFKTEVEAKLYSDYLNQEEDFYEKLTIQDETFDKIYDMFLGNPGDRFYFTGELEFIEL